MKITPNGAKELTAVMDRIATVVQKNPEILGIDPKIAFDFAHRIDLISDAVETTAAINFPEGKTAYRGEPGSKLDDRTVQGYAGFTDQIRELDELATKSQELAAQIEAAVGPLLEQKAGLDKDIKRVHEIIKKEYKANLTTIGNVTIERKTKLVEAQAMMKVTERKATLTQVQKKLLAAVTEKYGAEVAAFIAETSEHLQETNKQLTISFKGFELEQKAARTASAREAGIVDMLTKFQDLLMRGWKRMVGFIQNAAKLVVNAARPVEAAHDDFMSTLKDINSGKMASDDQFAGFNLFA